jgi:hypothetical protein
MPMPSAPSARAAEFDADPRPFFHVRLIMLSFQVFLPLRRSFHTEDITYTIEERAWRTEYCLLFLNSTAAAPVTCSRHQQRGAVDTKGQPPIRMFNSTPPVHQIYDTRLYFQTEVAQP